MRNLARVFKIVSATILIALVALIFLVNISNLLSDSTSPKEKITDKVIERAATKIKKDTELHPCGTGGQMMKQIEMLAISFDYYKPVDIDSGRELLLAAVNELVDSVNQNEGIRPYLGNYPFEPVNVEIRIFLRNLDGSDNRLGDLTVLSALRGTLEYDIRDPETERLKTVYEETYEEAVKNIALSHRLN